MPDTDSKKSQHKKNKNDPKEQRKPRQQRNQAHDKKAERKNEEHKDKVAVSEKPEYTEPGPEFYQGLKRETDEILRITQEVDAKYKKKEIQSNWAKYEVPIESYDEVEEQENLGADYEKLIQAPLSIGGHFQFKHEKSWDISTGPSLYDKYFDINMNDLATALCTIPFYERNGIDKSVFTENDIQTMDQRTSRYKHKYFKIATTESELQDKLIQSLKEDYNKTEEVHKETPVLQLENNLIASDINFDAKSGKTEITPESKDNNIEIVFLRPDKHSVAETKVAIPSKSTEEFVDNIDDIILGTNESIAPKKPDVDKVKAVPESKVVSKAVSISPEQVESKKNPVIESPEDLEKWLDDFLDE